LRRLRVAVLVWSAFIVLLAIAMPFALDDHAA